MGYTVELGDLRGMTASEQDRVLSELVSAAKGARNGQAAVINSRIRQFEQRYELSSDELVEKLRRGNIHETAEIAEWLFLLKARATRGSG